MLSDASAIRTRGLPSREPPSPLSAIRHHVPLLPTRPRLLCRKVPVNRAEKGRRPPRETAARYQVYFICFALFFAAEEAVLLDLELILSGVT